MKKLFTITLVSCAATLVQPAQAGGILTNTNQNIAFNRMMSRDAAIGIDGVYTNPAGVAFMDDGWHLSLNWQYAHQTRTILTTNPDFVHGMENDGRAIKKFKGNADAPIIPPSRLPIIKVSGACKLASPSLAVVANAPSPTASARSRVLWQPLPTSCSH